MAKNPKIRPEPVLAKVRRGGPDTVLTRGEAAALIDHLLSGAKSYERRKVIANQLDAAKRPRSNRCKIPAIAETDKGFTSSNLRRWVCQLYREDLSDLPWHTGPRAVVVQEKAVLNDSYEVELYPGTLAECHTLIGSLRARCRELQQRLDNFDKDRKRAVRERLDKRR